MIKVTPCTGYVILEEVRQPFYSLAIADDEIEPLFRKLKTIHQEKQGEDRPA